MVPPLSNWSDLKNRTLSSVALALIGLFCVWMGGVILASLIIFAAITMIREWKNLTSEQGSTFYIIGYPYVILPCACILWLRTLSVADDPLLGMKILFALMLVISATDIGAYFIGKQFGDRKLWPSISPNKTWEGLAGGIAAATVTGMLFALYIHIPKVFIAAIFISPLIALTAQAGDLFKSWIKRKAGVKDAGNLIPGHGGLLDRLDGYMFAAPLLSFIVYCALQ